MKRRYFLSIMIIVFALFFYAIIHDSAKYLDSVPRKDNTVNIDVEKQDAPAQKGDMIVVSSPIPKSTVSASPIVIKGRARGNWFFEAIAPVSVVNWDGLIIGEGYIKVDEPYEWMTTEYVPFTGTISYDSTQIAPYKRGSIIIKKANASGEPRFDDALEFTILFP